METKEMNVASPLIESNSLEYGQYILRNHFPSLIDGLKKVHRRIIWAMKDKTKRFSGLTLTGATSSLHPYNDVSIYESAVKLSQSFNTVFPLLDLYGENGSYSGDVAAASRYVDFEVSEFCKDVFLRGIEMQTISFELTESLIGFEPSFFIPKIPTGLISYSETIGFGFKSLTLAYPMEVVCDLVESYANHLDKHKTELSVKWDYSEFIDQFIPYFPIKNIIRNKSQLLKEYKLGNFNAPILLDGVIKIIDESSVLIITIPFRNMILNMEETLINTMKNKKDEFGKNIDYKTQSSTEKEADILIKFKKSTNFFEMVERLKDVIKFSSLFSPFNNFPEDGKVVDKSPIQALKAWYKERYYSILGKKKYQQQRLINRKRQLEALLIVGANVTDIIDIIHKQTEMECLKSLMEKYKLTFYQSKYIRNSKISILAKTDIEKIKEEYETVNSEIDNLLASFNKIHKEIINDAKFFRDKYPTPDNGSYCPEYLGYIVIKDKGILVFESLIEMSKLISIFKNETKKVYLFPKEIKDIIIVNKFGNFIKWDTDILMEKISNNIGVMINSSHYRNTIVLKNNNTFRIEGLKFASDADQLFHTNSDSFKTLLQNGSIVNMSISDIPIRTNTSQMGNKTQSIYFWDDSEWGDEEYLMFTHSTAANTKISINKINKDTKSIVTYVGGVTTVLGIFLATDEDIILNLNNGFVCHIKMSEIDIKKKEFMYSKYKV